MDHIRRFALRHKATQQFMPEFENGRGYTHWSPGAGIVDVGVTGSIRLFMTYRAADIARTMWTRGVFERRYTEASYESLYEETFVKPRDVGRKKDDLEIVQFALTEVVS